MDPKDTANGRIRVGFRQALGLLLPYVRERLTNQIKSVWLIIVYLILFQTLVLGIAIAEASLIAAGIGLVVVGLTLFMEGLLLGLMPLGERVGLRLPQKSTLVVVLAFTFLLGFLTTLAEPSIQILQTTGRSVKAWEAPLLYLMLTKHSYALVYSVGLGVGAAVLLGMVRFYRSWSLKPLIYCLVAGLVGLTAWSFFDRNMIHLTGLAWDCGSVTTGPVTVPLVLALGIGISRMVGSQESGSMGIELGLDKLGTQVGNRFPSSFKSIPLPEQKRTILEFDPSLVQRSISPDGRKHSFFTPKREARFPRPLRRRRV